MQKFSLAFYLTAVTSESLKVLKTCTLQVKDLWVYIFIKGWSVCCCTLPYSINSWKCIAWPELLDIFIFPSVSVLLFTSYSYTSKTKSSDMHIFLDDWGVY